MPSNSNGYLLAEDTFDNLNQGYEDAFGENPGLIRAVRKVVDMLPTRAKVLDVGCGTGRPVCQILADADIEVHGIDISEKMVQLARVNVPKAKFSVADMVEYKPPCPYDAVLSILNLFQFPHNTVRAQMTRFAEWLRPGGLFLLCMVGGECRQHDSSLFDPEWEYIDERPIEFMGQPVQESLVTTAGWLKLVETTGLDIVSSEVSTFKPKDFAEEPYLYIFGRKTDRHPLFGPYPPPKSYRGPHLNDSIGNSDFVRFLASNTQSPELESHGTVLYMDTLHNEIMSPVSGPGPDVLQSSAKQDSNGIWPASSYEAALSIGRLPFSNDAFSAVIARSILHHTTDLTGLLQEVVRILDVTEPNARVVIYQATPYNQVIELMNRYCVPFNTVSFREPDHQGYLLQTAMDVFESLDLRDIRISRTAERLEFDGRLDVAAAARQAADVITGLWYRKDPARTGMQVHLGEELKKRFQHQIDLREGERPSKYTIGNDNVMLVARPG